MSGHERAFPRPSRMRRALVPVVPPFTGNRYPSAVYLLTLSHRDASRGEGRGRDMRPSSSLSFEGVAPSVTRIRVVRLSLSLSILFLLSTPGLLPFGPALFIPPSVSSHSLRNIRIDSSADPSDVRSFFLSFFLLCARLARAQYSFPPLVSRGGSGGEEGSPPSLSPRLSHAGPLFFRLLRATNAILIIIAARLVIATVSSPMRDDVGSEWLHVAATLRWL